MISDVYLFIMAAVLAAMEIQIEGANGWAKNLPAWRPRANSPLARFYARIMSGKELTGYHVAVFTFVLLVFGLPFAYGMPLTVENAFKMASLFFLFVIIWDFLWFVFNPAFGLEKFKAGLIYWHREWIGPIPRDYAKAIAVSLLLAVFPGWKHSEIFAWWALNTLSLLAMTALITLCIWIFPKKRPPASAV